LFVKGKMGGGSMKREELVEGLREICTKVIKTAEAKNKDYALEDDAFSNFRIIGEFLNIADPGLEDGKYMCWLVYFCKHFLSVLNYLRTRKVYTESIEGRIIDMIVYLAILYLMIEEDEK